MSGERGGHLRAVVSGTPLSGEALAAAIVESAADAIVALTFDGTVMSWNRGAEALFGYRADEVVDANLSALAPPDAAGDLASALTGITLGASVKPFDTALRHRDGSRVEVTMTVSPVRDQTGRIVCASALSRGMATRSDIDTEVAYMALHDTVTGLPNRALGEDRLAACLHVGGRQSGSLAVLFVDLDHFKTVNDRFGHVAGDQVLRAAAERLESVLRPGDTVYRYGGDEFIIVCSQIRDAGQALTVAERVARALRFSFQVDGDRFVSISASIGVAIGTLDDTPSGLVHKADRAMYKAKDAGRARVELFDQSDESERDLADSYH